MKSTDSPKKHGVAFAENGLKNSIPHHDSASSSAASLEKGFPPVTMMKKTQGGLPPDGKDMNGILNELSALSRWYSAGALNKFDIAFSKEIGGYPKGALLIGDDEETLYLSTQEDNANNPNESKTGWIKYQDYLIENIPNASLTQKGLVQLANAVSQDQTRAATPKCVDDFKSTLGTTAYRNIGTGDNDVPDMRIQKSIGNSSGLCQFFPSGLKIQFNQVITDQDGQFNWTFPTPYTIASRGLFVSPNNGDIIFHALIASSATGVTVRTYNAKGIIAPNIGVNLLSVGY